MRYRSAAFARQSAHALAGVGSTHFPARGVDADALLGTAAVLYLLRFSGDVVTAEQTFVTGVVTPVRVVAAEILVTLAEVVRIDVVRPAPVRLAIICLAVLRGGARGARRLSRVTIARECASTAAAPSPRIEFVTQLRAPTTTTTRC